MVKLVYQSVSGLIRKKLDELSDNQRYSIDYISITPKERDELRKETGNYLGDMSTFGYNGRLYKVKVEGYQVW
jgi:hypothetical protein